MKKHLYISLAICVILAGMLGGGLLFILNTGPGQRVLKDFIADQISAQMNGRLEIGRLKIITLRYYEAFDVRIRNYGSADCPELSARHMRARIHLLPLLSGRIVFPWVRAWDMTAVWDNNARENLPNIFTIPPERLGGPSVNVDIDKAIIDGFTIVFRDTLAHITVRSDIDSLRGTLKGSYFFSYRIWSRGTDVRVDDMHWNVDSLYGDLYTDSVKIVFNRVGLHGSPDLRLNGAGWIGFRDTLSLGGQISGSAAAASTGMVLAALKVPGIDRSGDIAGSVTFGRSIAHPTTVYRAEAHNFTYKGAVISRVDAAGSAADGFFKSTTSLQGDPGDLEIDYRIHPAVPGRRSGSVADISGRQVDLEHALRMVDADDISLRGSTDLKLHLEQDSGLAQPRSFEATFSGQLLRLTGSAGPGVDAEGSVDYRNGHWKTAIRSPGATLDGNGTLDPRNRLAGTFSFGAADADGLATAITADHLAGPLSAELTVGGTVARPVLAGTAHGDTLQWGGISIDSLDGGFTFDRGIFRFVNTGVRVHCGAAEAFRLFGIADVAGEARAQLCLNGPFDSLDAAGPVSGTHISWAGTALFDSLSADIISSPGRVLIGSFYGCKDATQVKGSSTLVIDPADISGVGEFSLADSSRTGGLLGFSIQHLTQDSITASLKVSDLSLAQIQPWLHLQGVPGLGGVFGASADFSGCMSNPSASATFVGNHIALPGISEGSVSGSLGLRDSLLTLSAGIRFPDSAALSAQLAFRPGTGWAFDTLSTRLNYVGMSGTGINLAPFVRLAVQGVSLSDARSDLDLRLVHNDGGWWPDGTMHVPAVSLHAQGVPVAITGLSARFSGFSSHSVYDIGADAVRLYDTPAAKVHVAGSFDRNFIVVDTGTCLLPGGGINVSGTMPISPLSGRDRTYVDFRTKGLPLETFNSFMPGINISKGTINAQCIIATASDRLVMYGQISADTLECAPDGIGPLVGPLSGTLRFEGDSLIVKSLSGKWGPGTVSGSLRGVFDSVWAFSGVGAVKGRGLVIELPEAAVGIDSADLSISLGRRYRISGAIALGETDWYQSVSILGGAAASPADSTSSRVDMDLRLDLQRKLTAEISFGQQGGRSLLGTRALLDGNLIVTGTAVSPRLSGEIEAVEGTMTFLDRTFIISSGTFRQYDQLAYNPEIHFIASAAVENLQSGLTDTVGLTVSGTLNEPQITLSSKPPYKDAEILSLLTFGRPSLIQTGTTPGATGQNPDYQGRAGSILLSQVYGYTAKKAADILGFDQMSIDANLIEKPDRPIGFNVSGSKRLTSALRVGASVDYSKDNGPIGMRSSKASLSWRLLPFLYLEGEAAADGTGGIDIKFKWER